MSLFKKYYDQDEFMRKRFKFEDITNEQRKTIENTLHYQVFELTEALRGFVKSLTDCFK